MKLVMTLLVRDEEDIIAANIDYHLSQGVDFFIVTDNLSEDRTREILETYEKEGLLHYIYEDRDDYSQNRWVTRMAKLAATDFGADWVINNDADEFWWPEYGSLKKLLSAIPPEINAVVAQRVNFPPVSSSPQGFFADIMTVREVQSLNAIGKPLPPKVCHRACSDIQVAQGNHSVEIAGTTIKPQPAPITIFHFPLRSYTQFANKIQKGGSAYERNIELPESVGSTWRKWYQMLHEGTLKDYFQSQVLDEQTLKKGFQVGKLVRDERLKRYLKNIK